MYHHRNFSVYVAFVAWGVAGFMGQPTIPSFVAHFIIMPVILALLIAIAHHEGKRRANGSRCN